MTRDDQTPDCIDDLLPLSQQDDSFDRVMRDLSRLEPVTCLPKCLPERDELVSGKYKIDEPLASGGMGAVFRATHVVSGRQVALKWLLPASRVAPARFVREARAAGKIHHPNVVNVYDVDQHAGSPYLVMELLSGHTLAKRIKEQKLTPRELARVMIPMLRGLGAAHAQGIIHRDLKPDNVFLCEAADGAASAPKVLDFGIAKMRADLDQGETLTGVGTALGTLPYMSPEQLEDAPAVDERTDIYAAGVIMYEALAGQRPFRASSDAALMRAILVDRPAPLRALEPSVPAPLERVVLRAMARKPRDRFADVDALIRELAPWAEDVGGETGATTRLGKFPRTRRGHAGAALLSLAAAGLLVALFLQGGPTLPPVANSERAHGRELRAAQASAAEAQPSDPLPTLDPSALQVEPERSASQAGPRAKTAAELSVRSGLARRNVRVKPRAGSIRIDDL